MPLQMHPSKTPSLYYMSIFILSYLLRIFVTVVVLSFLNYGHLLHTSHYTYGVLIPWSLLSFFNH